MIRQVKAVAKVGDGIALLLTCGHTVYKTTQHWPRKGDDADCPRCDEPAEADPAPDSLRPGMLRRFVLGPWANMIMTAHWRAKI